MSIYDPLNHDYRCLERPQPSDRSLLERALPWLEDEEEGLRFRIRTSKSDQLVIDHYRQCADDLRSLITEIKEQIEK